MTENVIQIPRLNSESSSEDGAELTEQASNPKPVRGRSTIEFPYADLQEALTVAITLQGKGAVAMTKDQLAAALGKSPENGSFLSKLHTARLFGLIAIEQDGRVRLTDLGFEAICSNEGRASAAKANAFLNVQLFKKTYDEFLGKPLPVRPHGLESQFVKFGVIEKRATNARWSFERSAKQAGFFESGDDRLVMPVLPAVPSASIVAGPPPVQLSETPPDPLPKPAQEPLIIGLLDRLPSPGSDWPLKERVRWLRALAVNFGMVYGGVEDGDLEIKPTPNSKGVVPAIVPATVAPVIRPAASSPQTTRRSIEPSPSWEPQKSADDLDDEIPF